jgi:HNH endonuclease
MSVYIAVDLQRRIRHRFQGCCAYCRTAEALTATTFEFEHMVPLSLGGLTIFENLCLACPSCNRCKGDRLEGLDPVTQERVRLFHPHLQRWDDHFSWSQDCCELVGVTACGRGTIEALRMNRDALVRVRHLWVKLGEHPPVLEEDWLL